jgi:hypothetical protein
MTADGSPSVAKTDKGLVNFGVARLYAACGVSPTVANLEDLAGSVVSVNVGPETKDGKPNGYARVNGVYPVK